MDRHQDILEILNLLKKEKIMKAEPNMKSTDIFQGQKVKTTEEKVWWVI
jgi:hypothetical protein